MHLLTPLTHYQKTLADGIVAAPILSGHDVIHYGDGKSGFVIGTGEFAAGKQRDPHGREIGGADLVVLDRGLLVGRGVIAIDGDGRGRKTAVAQRRASREGRGLDAGEGLDALEERIVKSFGAVGIVSGAPPLDPRQD